ncbi:hypothetical protein JCM10213_004918 [Rhodosporidiobolus nylandii]
MEDPSTQGGRWPPQPDIQRDFAAWNKYWEWRNDNDFPSDEHDMTQSFKWKALASDHALFDVEQSQALTNRQVARFAREYLKSPLARTLPMIMAQKSQEIRENIAAVGFGLAQVWSGEGDLRSTVHELTLANLASPDTYRALLNHFVESGIRFPDGDGMLEHVHPRFDWANNIERTDDMPRLPPTVRFAQRGVLCLRQQYLFFVTLGMSEAIAQPSTIFTLPCAIPHVVKPVLPGAYIDHLPRNPFNDRFDYLRDVQLPTDEQERFQAMARRHAVREGKKAALESCHACWRRLDQIPRNGKEAPPSAFSSCSRCDCQRRHWAAHKAVCGKHYADALLVPIGRPAPPTPPSAAARWNLHTSSFPVVYNFLDPKASELCLVPVRLRLRQPQPQPLDLPSLPSAQGSSDIQLRRQWDELQCELKALVETADGTDMRKVAHFLKSCMLRTAPVDRVSPTNMLFQLAYDFGIEVRALAVAIDATSIR